MMKRPALFLATAALFMGCSTDLDINAEYKDITIVYGLLNMRDSVHYLKINKAFLGEGDALGFAQIADSNEWSDADISYAKVFRELDGVRVDSFDLSASTVTGREPGVFYSPDQKIYTFTDQFREVVNQSNIPVTLYLDEDSEYILELIVKGQLVRSRTTIVNDFRFQNADQNTNITVSLYNSQGYRDFILDWDSGKDGKRYEATARFNYREIRNGTDTSDVKSVMIPLGTQVATNSAVSQSMSRTLEGERFYSTIASSIVSDPSVTRRLYLGLDFLMSVANDEFHTYLVLTEPISGIVEDRPTYSNVENGVGVFGSRYSRNIEGKRLDGASLNELTDGAFTAGLLFCSPLQEDQGGASACP